MSTSTSTTSLSSNAATEPSAGTVLRGVPAVAGVQYAPVIRPGARPRVDADATASGLDESARAEETARFTAAAGAVAARLRERAANASARRPRYSQPPPRWLRTGPGSAAAEKRIKDGTPAVAAVVGGGRAVRRHVHPARRADGGTRHRPARHPRPRHRGTERPAGARRPAARDAVDPVRRGSRARRHRGPGPDARCRPRHHTGRADQPHRDHRPAARHPVRRRRRGTRCRAAGNDGARRRHPRAQSRWRRMPQRAQARPSPQRSARPNRQRVVGSGCHRRRPRGSILANVQDGAAARAAERDPGRRRRPVPHRTVLPQPRHRTQRR